MCEMTQVYVSQHVHMCDMAHVYALEHVLSSELHTRHVWHDSSICVTTRSYVWHDSCICVRTRSIVWTAYKTRVTWLKYMCHNMLTCGTYAGHYSMQDITLVMQQTLVVRTLENTTYSDTYTWVMSHVWTCCDTYTWVVSHICCMHSRG